MSKIITPKQTIIIEIDGLTGNTEMRCSHDMPGMFVARVFAMLIANICGQAEQMQSGIVTKLVSEKPVPEPSKTS